MTDPLGELSLLSVAGRHARHMQPALTCDHLGDIWRMRWTRLEIGWNVDLGLAVLLGREARAP